jgi:hypothetical protein
MLAKAAGRSSTELGDSVSSVRKPGGFLTGALRFAGF